MSESARTIRLRRPPQLNKSAERFVPRVPLAEVTRHWTELCRENPHYFDGNILHVLGVSRNGHGGVLVHVAETSYRFYAVQRAGLECGVRPIGAKGIVEFDGRFLMGRRSDDVAFYPGEWEFLPGGGLEPDDDPASCVLRELREETAFKASAPPIAVALLYDPGALSWEVIHRITVIPRPDAGGTGGNWEHQERMLVAPGTWPEPLCAVARAMIELMGGEEESSEQ